MTTVPRNSPKRNDTRKYSWKAWTLAYLALAVQVPFWCLVGLYARLFGRIPAFLTRKLLRMHDSWTESQPMDFRIPPDDAIPAYMWRWWRIVRNAFFNIYYHNVRRSDDDRALHDHPWVNLSIVLDGGYFEHVILEGGVHRKTWFGPGSVRFRWHGKKAHRLELERVYHQNVEDPTFSELPVKTIFITGPVLRRWGFHHPDGWVDAYDWDAFCAERGVVTMKMGGGSDGAISARNKHHA